MDDFGIFRSLLLGCLEGKRRSLHTCPLTDPGEGFHPSLLCMLFGDSGVPGVG